MPIDNIAELGFAGLSAVLLFGLFKFITSELTKKLDRLESIIIKLIDSKNEMKNEFKELNDEVTDQLNYIEAKLGNGRGSKQKRKAGA
tara:strand:- start:1619 stop:1882 length:264 start_codon:yes stop_codon:yes gene_type:complete